MLLTIDVVAWRGVIPESRHRVQLAVADPDGSLVAATEHPHVVTTFRSAAKPFQLLPLVERGHAERWGWSDEELAIMASSHTGSAYHVGLVEGILSRLELSDRHLACGYHEPLEHESQERLRARPEERSALYNNCSGKHAGMLCLALSEGWPVEHYERPDHPVQQLMRRTVAEVCGIDPEAVAVGVDGCSVSVFGLPLSGMARGFARLAAAAAAGNAREVALHRIRTAMQSHPRAVGGKGRLSTALMEACSRWVAKGGAEGLECMGLSERRLGIAVKCEDGQSRAVPPALLGLLECLGELGPAELNGLRSWKEPELRNHAGLVVGRLEASIGTPAAASAGHEQ